MNPWHGNGQGLRGIINVAAALKDVTYGKGTALQHRGAKMKSTWSRHFQVTAKNYQASRNLSFDNYHREVGAKSQEIQKEDL